MKIYLISQNVNNHHDTYDAMVVIAKNEERAKELTLEYHKDRYASAWAAIEHLEIKHIGTALKGSKEEIILQSFNAG